MAASTIFCSATFRSWQKITKATALSLGLVGLFSITGCATDESTPQVQRTVIHGIITNPAGNNASISIADTSYKTELDAEGKFTLVFNLDEPDYARLRIGPEYTISYLQPGDSVELRLDATQFDQTLSYSGNGAEINNYMAAKMVRNLELNAAGNPYLMDEAAFVEKMNSNHTLQKSDLQAAGLDAQFSTREGLELDYVWAGQLANYQQAHRYYAEDETFEVSASFWDFVKDLDLNNDWNASSDAFASFASAYLTHQAETSAPDISDPALLSMHQMDLVESTFSNPKIHSTLYGTILTEYLSYEGIDGAAPLYDRYKAAAPADSKDRKKLDKMYSDWEKLASGMPAQEFSGQRLDGSTVSIGDLKGKTVYVDVWATWCGPCRAELPYLEAMQEEFKDNDQVVLMSISIDDDKKAWETMVTDKAMGGLQLFTEGAWSSDVIKRYQINGIPRFMIIGPDGNISDAQAPRPSSGEVSGLLNQLSGTSGTES